MEFLMLIVVLVWACAKKDSKKDCLPAQANFPVELEGKKLSEQLNAIKDSVSTYKSKAFSSEDLKIQLTQSLLNKLSNQPNIEPSFLLIAKSEFENAQKTRYNESNFNEDAAVSQYDTYTLNYMEAISRIRGRISNFVEIEGAEKEFLDLAKAGDEDIRLRFKYNRFAMIYNSLLDCNKAELVNSEHNKPFAYFYGTKPEFQDVPLEERGDNEGFE
jgi:hypothetical protein